MKYKQNEDAPNIAVEEATANGPALMNWRRRQGINRKTFATLAHFSERKLATYEKAGPLPETVARPVRETVRLLHALGEIVPDRRELKTWLETPNPAFDERTPTAVIQSGEGDTLWSMIYQVRHGTYA